MKLMSRDRYLDLYLRYHKTAPEYPINSMAACQELQVRGILIPVGALCMFARRNRPDLLPETNLNFQWTPEMIDEIGSDLAARGTNWTETAVIANAWGVGLFEYETERTDCLEGAVGDLTDPENHTRARRVQLDVEVRTVRGRRQVRFYVAKGK